MTAQLADADVAFTATKGKRKIRRSSATRGKAEGEGYWDGMEVENRKAEAVRDLESVAYLRWDIHVGVGRREA